MKYHLVTLGCQMNKSDSERVKTVIEGMGFSWTENEQEANLLGVLACSVRQKSIDKVYSKIFKWNKRKDRESLITFISGCVLPADEKRFLKLFDMIFTMNELPQFPDMIRQYGIVTPASLRHAEEAVPQKKEDQSTFTLDFSQLSKEGKKLSATDIQLSIDEEATDIDTFWDIKPEYASTFEAFIPIQNGCDKFCTFCAVPYTRGREVSRSSVEIVDEVKRLVNEGYKSITLLGQNVNSYGLDKKGEEISFAELLNQIGEFGNETEHDFWVYFTSPHPRDMGNDVIDVIAEYKCLGKQIHLPLQSGDDKVLIRMNRKHSLQKYRDIVEYIRLIIPQSTIFTDIIVGFTGETEKQFVNTSKAMEEFAFNMAYVAVYSPRPGATSSRWDDDIAMAEKKARLHRLTDVFAKSSRAWNEKMVDQTVRVLVTGTERKSGYLTAHTEGRVITRIYSYDKSLIGKFIDVNVVSTTDFSLAGEVVESKVMA
jgi:tRNA-2-methylthio-N6-dimethylallyladenosine synthase